MSTFEKILGFQSHNDHMRIFKFCKLSDVENIIFYNSAGKRVYDIWLWKYIIIYLHIFSLPKFCNQFYPLFDKKKKKLFNIGIFKVKKHF